MYTINLDDIATSQLPKRGVKILVGGDSRLQSSRMTFGVATVAPHCAMDPHDHTKEEEIIYIMTGHGYVEIDGVREALRPGTVIQLPPGCSHAVCNESAAAMTFTFCFHPPVVVGSYDKK